MDTLTTCPNCIEIAAQRTTPHGEPYTICPTCGAMMFEDTERDSEFYAAAQPPDTRHPTPDTRPAAKVNWSSAAAHLARLHRSAQAALKPTSDDVSPVLFELALTDPCALAEFLRAHTPVQRDMLAWRYAAWISRRHGITVLPAFIASNWAALLNSTAAPVDGELLAACEAHIALTAVRDPGEFMRGLDAVDAQIRAAVANARAARAQQCAESGS